MAILSFLLFLMIAASYAAIAKWLSPGLAPAGFLANAIIGIIGASVGSALFGHFGPDIAGIAFFPATLGAAFFVFVLGLLYSPA